METINTAGIVLLALLAIYKLDEKASVIDWVGIGSIVLGLIFMAMTMTAKTQEFYYNAVILWFLVVFLLAASLMAFINGLKKKDDRSPIFIAIGTGILVGTNAIWIKLGMHDIWTRFWDQSLGAALSTPYLWIIIIFAVGTLFLQQIALQRGKAIIVIPVITGISNLIPILVGILAFREPFPTNGYMILLRLISIVMVIGGAILLSLGKTESGLSLRLAKRSNQLVSALFVVDVGADALVGFLQEVGVVDADLDGTARAGDGATPAGAAVLADDRALARTSMALMKQWSTHLPQPLHSSVTLTVMPSRRGKMRLQMFQRGPRR